MELSSGSPKSCIFSVDQQKCTGNKRTTFVNWQLQCLVSCRTIILQERTDRAASTELATWRKLIHSSVLVCRRDVLGMHRAVLRLVVQLVITMGFSLKTLYSCIVCQCLSTSRILFLFDWLEEKNVDRRLYWVVGWCSEQVLLVLCTEFHLQGLFLVVGFFGKS